MPSKSTKRSVRNGRARVAAHAAEKDELFRQQIGANVSRLREDKGMKPTELAAAVGVERIRISRIEKGEHAPGAALLLRLAKALGTTAEKLAE